MKNFDFQNFKTVFNLLKENQKLISEYFHDLTRRDSSFFGSGRIPHMYLDGHLIKDGLVERVENGDRFGVPVPGNNGSAAIPCASKHAYQLTEKGRNCDFDAYLNELSKKLP
jgi:hypothetical protein